jgi:hypothetical protein
VCQTKYVDGILRATYQLKDAKARRRRSYPNILRCECAVLSVALFWESAAQIWVEICHHRAGGVQVLEKQKHEGEFIQQVDSEDNAPECRVGTDERPITKL